MARQDLCCDSLLKRSRSNEINQSMDGPSTKRLVFPNARCSERDALAVRPLSGTLLHLVVVARGVPPVECPSCHAETPGLGKFCAACGAALAIECPSCGRASPASAKFCFECGQKL